jgi:hypothetical protein
MNSVARDSSINFSALFGDVFSPLHYNVPFNPSLMGFVHRCLERWIIRLQSDIWYPDSSTKTISATSRSDFFEYFDQADDGRPISTLNLEQVYHSFGYKVKGPCELRQRWIPAQITPRTYFAMGGDMYHISKYCGHFFEELTQSFPPTEKYTRVRPDFVSIDDDEEFYIFDLTSFTSNMHEQRGFIVSLANFARGVEVRIFDSRIGAVSVDLGDMLEEYLSTCFFPEFTISSSVMNWDLKMCHSVAGFLGVYGNLMSCTFPHGVVNSMSGTRIDSSYTAGDDAGVATRIIERQVHDSEEVLGILAREKVYLLREKGAVALKRPVYQFGGSIVVRRNIIWPSFCYLFSQEEWDKRFDKFLTWQDRKKSFSRAMFSFMSQLVDVDISVEERCFVVAVLEPIYERLGIPRNGQLFHTCNFPSILVQDVGICPYTILLNRFPPVTFRLPAIIELVVFEGEMYEGQVLESRMTKYFGWCCKMRYLEQSIIEEEVFVQDRFYDVIAFLKGERRLCTYRFSVLEIPPYSPS